MMKKIKDNLAEVERVTTTADVWTAHHKSYLGMTVHWINEKSLKREKQVLLAFAYLGVTLTISWQLKLKKCIEVLDYMARSAQQ